MPSEPVRGDHRREPARGAEPRAGAAADAVRLRRRATDAGSRSSGVVHDFDLGDRDGVAP
jgi:hypothetical protein